MSFNSLIWVSTFLGIDRSRIKSFLELKIKSLVIVGFEPLVATIKTSALLISLVNSPYGLTIIGNLTPIFSAFSWVLLIKTICLFFVCFKRFSHVFLPILPTPKRTIFFLEIVFTLFIIYWTEA